MPRIQAEDYGDKKRAIMDCAAEQFSRVGFPAARLDQIAKSCGASKSMLYHYFPNKEALLFAILGEHLKTLIDAFDSLATGREASERFREFISTYTSKSVQARSRHVVAMNDKKFLSAARVKKIVAMERQLLERVSDLLKALRPGLPRHSYHPYALMLIGLLNWTDLWYQPDGAIKPDEMCDRISQLFLRGFLQSS